MTLTDPFEHSWNLIRVTRTGALAEVTIAREEARNALSTELIAELTEVARLLRMRTDVQAVILTGAATFFSAGADLRERTKPLDSDGLLEARRNVMGGPEMCRAWAEIEAVTIAAVEGFCIGGGCALATSCDFRVLGRSATLRLPEVPLGMNMSWRVLPRLVAMMGPGRAKRFVMFGEALGADDSLDWGLADEVV
ncbi:MAG TPA: enoyl-CoA hydratase/isomerase family protein, partial [Phenylobacterium sp.]